MKSCLFLSKRGGSLLIDYPILTIFFTNIGESLASKIPSTTRSPMSYLTHIYHKTIFLRPVSKNELILIMKQLKSNTSAGYDDLSPKVLQYGHQLLIDPLKHLVNLSLSQGIFPDELKIAKVLPLFKGGNQAVFNNYRPISILCSLSKIFERIFYNRLFEFLKQEDILYDKQFGFRKAHSTDMALTLLLDQISHAMEQGEYVLGVFLDFSKAFDTVNHDILLSKLDHYGIRGVANKWVSSYLSNRTQYVSYDGHTSVSKNIKCGVPQGSILGPLLFLIYINDLSKISHHLYMIMFADDTNVFLSGQNLAELESVMNSELKCMYEWLCANKLSLNINKTHYMIFAPARKKILYDCHLRIENEEISRVYETKFLGVMLDSNLTWKSHIKYIKSKLCKSLGIIGKARRYLHKESLVNLYYSFLYPYLVFCITIWGGACISTLQPLISIQKRALRIICSVSRISASLPLFKSLKMLPIRQIYHLQLIMFVYKFKQGILPDIFNNFFTKTTDIHTYRTRQFHNFYPPRCKTDISKSLVRYNGCVVWNSLQQDLKNIDVSPFTFKKHILKQLHDSQL